MTFVQATTGGGGWPMSVWLTPELKPFFGGTYFPPDDRYGRAGFRRRAGADRRGLAAAIARRSSNRARSHRAVAEAGGRGSRAGSAALDTDALDSGFLRISAAASIRSYGGFGERAEIPASGRCYNFLLRYYARTRNQEALDMVLATLREMAKGGMNDQLGGGFHRYSVDERWFVPHFEKMLYDQAQLAISYLEAFQITHDQMLRRRWRATFCDYVLRDMTRPRGRLLFRRGCRQRDRSRGPEEKGEGAFYIWTQAEIDSDCSASRRPNGSAIATAWKSDGNVANDPHQRVHRQQHSVPGAHGGGDGAAFRAAGRGGPGRIAADASAKLLEARSQRVRPHLDDKVLTAWNGLMISAFAKAGAVLDEPAIQAAARRAADFIVARVCTTQRRACCCAAIATGDAAIPGFLDDYAFFTQALLDLYETAIRAARSGTGHAADREDNAELFEDTSSGGFFSTAAGDPDLVMRMKDDYDGAEPSGNSIAVMNLLRLAQITGSRRLPRIGRTALRGLRLAHDARHRWPCRRCWWL